MALHWPWSNMLVPFTGKPKSGHGRVLQMWPRKRELEGNSHFPKAAGCSLANAAWHVLSFRCLKGALLTRVQQLLYLRSCSAELLLPQLVSSLPCCKGFFCPMWRTLHLFCWTSWSFCQPERMYNVCSISKSIIPSSRGRSFLCVSLWVLAFWLLPEAHGWETSLHPTALANSSALQNICGL